MCLKMSSIQLLLCFFGFSAIFSISNVQARLEGEGIIGGDDADEGQFPYQVSIEILGRSTCGGSILDERFIITAAHCVVDSSGRFWSFPLKAVAGVNDLKSKSDRNRVAVDVIEVYVPKEYDPADRSQRTTGDIAILKLNKDLGIATNPNLDKVKLPEKGETYVGVQATISGFGFNTIELKTDPILNITQEVGGKSDDKMRYAKANVLTEAECRKQYYLPITGKHICAAVVQRKPKKPEGVCSGDSGGPLVYEGAQIGVVSTSPVGCREDSKAAVYTRVSEYVDFINKVLSDKTDKSIRSHTLKPFPLKNFRNI